MSTTAEYLAFLTRSGVRLWVENGQLRYHAKRGVFSAEELARLRSRKGEIIAELTTARVPTPDGATTTLAPQAIEAPLSFQQQWCLKLLEAYPDWRATLSHTFHLKGAVDSVALKKSLEGILHMHPSLRTRIVCTSGRWQQQIESGNGIQLPTVQVPGESGPERQRNAFALVRETESRALDPALAPLIAARLIRLAADEHFLVVLIHRLSADCLSVGQIVRDLWVLYAQPTQMGSSVSPDAIARYHDYTLRQHATDAVWRQKHTAYWNDYLAGAQPILWPKQEYAAPARRHVPRELESLESSFGVMLSARLREFGQQTQTLPALVTLSLYVAVLSRWCQQKDLLLPFVIAGRAASHERIVGCFSHLVYLRIRLDGTETFIELLKRVSNEYFKAAAFRQDCGRMVTEKPELLRGTLCQWLSWHPADLAESEPDDQMEQLGLEVENMRCQNLEELTNVPPDMVDLEINFFDADGDISMLAVYRTDRFAKAAPVRLMEKIRSTAEYAFRDSQVPVADWLPV